MNWGLKLYDIFKQDPISFQPTLDSMAEFFKKEDAKFLLEAIYTGDEFSFDFQFFMFSEVQWVRLTGIKENLLDGQFIVRGIIQNITKEKVKEEAQLLVNIELSSFEKGLEQFSIVARTDAKGRITHANDEFCRISKYSMEELIGQDHRIVNSGHHSKYFFKEMWDSIKQGKTWRGRNKKQSKRRNILLGRYNYHSDL